MKTLYDLLDVRPDDDSGKLKDAFRKAVKVSHPDLNTDDPDASARFMQVVRANAILSDPELRSVYDRMLEFERQQRHQPATSTAYNIVPDAIVVVVLAVVMAGAYTLYTNLPELSVYLRRISIAQQKVVTNNTAREATSVAAVQLPPPAEANSGSDRRDKLESAPASAPKAVVPTSNDETAVENAAPAAAGDAAAPPSQPVAESARDDPRGKLENAATPAPSAIVPPANDEVAPEGGAAVQPSPPDGANAGDSSSTKLESAPAAASNASAPAANDDATAEYAASAPSAGAPPATGNVVETAPSKVSSGSVALKNAQFYREQGIASYRNGDLTVAIADFDLAIRLDPNFADAYIDRGIALYRMREFDRAFADVAHAMRLENYHPAATPPLPKARPY